MISGLPPGEPIDPVAAADFMNAAALDEAADVVAQAEAIAAEAMAAFDEDDDQGTIAEPEQA